MNGKQRKTLQTVFSEPVRAAIKWTDIESLLVAAGCRVEEGRGSRVRFYHGQVIATFHRPHPKPDTDKGAVKAVRAFLEEIGVKP